MTGDQKMKLHLLTSRISIAWDGKIFKLFKNPSPFAGAVSPFHLEL